MAKDPPNTQEPKKKGGSSAFRKFERLAGRIVRVPKSEARDRGQLMAEIRDIYARNLELSERLPKRLPRRKPKRST